MVLTFIILSFIAACSQPFEDRRQEQSIDSTMDQTSMNEDAPSSPEKQTEPSDVDQELDPGDNPSVAPAITTEITPDSQNSLFLTGDQIYQLENELQALGYRETGMIDDAFDNQTALALQHLQWMNGLPITGEVDTTLFQKILAEDVMGVSFPPPFQAQSLSQFTTGQMLDGFLKERLVALGYLDSSDPAYNPFDFDPQTASAVLAFQRNNNLTEDGIVDFEVWNALFKQTSVNAVGESAYDKPETGDWSTAFYPIMDNPIDLAYDGQNIWVLHSEGEDALSNLLLRVNPEEGLLDQMPPVMLGDVGVPDNRIAEMLFDGSKLWFLLPQSFNPPQLINFIPGSAEKFLQFEFMDCQSGGCLPAESLGYDGEMIWATGGNQVWAINKGDGQRYLTYEVGWLTSGEMAFDGDCLWMAGESGIEAFHRDGDYLCTGSEESFALPPGPVIFDGERIWTADTNLDVVYWLDLASGAISAPISVGDEPGGFAFDGDTLWVANTGDDTIVGINIETQLVGPVIPTGSRPTALLFDGIRLWVANTGDRTLQMINIEDY